MSQLQRLRPQHRPLLALSAFVAIAAGLAACSAAPIVQTRSTLAYGEKLFGSKEVSESKLNEFRCSTCHRAGAADRPSLILSAGNLAGVSQQTSYWGGQEPDFLAAINHCRIYFMRARGSWGADEPQAQALFAYLSSLPAQWALPAAADWVVQVENIPGGDPVRGQTVYQLGCATCHGAAQTGEGRLAALVPPPILPNDTLREHAYLETDLQRRLVFLEKTRHGGFFGYGGVMPPFSRQRLPDADLAAVLAYLRVPDPR